MPADLRDVIALLQRDGLSAASRDALAALSPDDAVSALVEARFPQYAARAVDALGDALGDAFLQRADAAQRHDRGVAVLLCGALAARRRRGLALDARLDPWLFDQVRVPWADEVRALLREGLAALPPARREAAVFGDGARIAWTYLVTCSGDAAARLAVRVASFDPRDDLFPSWRHEVVAGLASLGASTSPFIAAALRSGEGSRAGRRVLTAALARLDGELDALRACLDDPDPVVRALARDGFDRRRAPLAPTARVPGQCLQARALRAAITREESASLAAYAASVAAEAKASQRPVDAVLDARPVPVPDPVRALAATAGAWLEALRAGAHDPPLYVFEIVMRACILAADGDALAPWVVADALCRMPPDDLDPLRHPRAFLALPEAPLEAVTRALGAMLSPEDAGNPLRLYDWLATRAAGDAPAFARGLVDPDPRIRLICERATGRRRAPEHRPFSLIALRAAFAPLRAGSHYGDFNLLAIDHEAQRWEASTRLDPDDEAAALRALDEAALALTLEGPLAPGEMALRMASAVEADDSRVREAQWSPTTRAGLADETIGTIVSDDPRVTRAEAAARVEALMALVGASPAMLIAQGVASAAWSWAWFVQDPSRRFSVMVLYLNDQ